MIRVALFALALALAGAAAGCAHNDGAGQDYRILQRMGQ